MIQFKNIRTEQRTIFFYSSVYKYQMNLVEYNYFADNAVTESFIGWEHLKWEPQMLL